MGTIKDTLDQLRTAHEEIGARHVRAVGMFDDELKVVGPDPAKTMSSGRRDPRVNWQVVDYVIQSLIDIGINPMFTTTFPAEWIEDLINLEALVTMAEGGITILVYNYIHDDQPDRGPISVRLDLPENSNQLYDVDSIQLIRLNRQENNIVNRWKEMGSPGYLKLEHLKYLKDENTIKASAEKPEYSKEENLLSFSMKTPASVFL